MREEAAENRLLQLLRERDKASEEKVELKPQTKRKRVVKKPAKPFPVQEQIQFLGKIFHTAEPSTKYTKIQNVFYDRLARNLSPAEQAIYSYIYRLSLGHHKRICIVGYNALGKATGVKSRETIRMAVSRLIEKKYVSAIGETGPGGTIYFVYLPEEIEQDISRDEILKTIFNNSNLTIPENSILKNGTLNISILNFNILTILKNSILKNGIVSEIHTEKEDQPTVPENGILKNGTHIKKILKESLSLKKTRENLVNKFYEKLNSRVSPEKKLKGYEEAKQLLTNYSPEEIECTIKWVIKNVPNIRSFALVPYVIDQALKARDSEEEEKEARKIAVQKAKEQEEREKKENELQKKINEIKSSLNKEELARIHQEAENTIKAQGNDKKFGQDILVRVKENEIIRNLYL